MLLILLISIFILTAIFFIPVNINVVFSYREDCKYFNIELTLLKIFKVQLIKNKIKNKIKKNNYENKIKKYISYLQIIKKLNVKWQYLKLDCNYGLGDPAYTAILYGVIWSIMGTVVTALNINKPEIKINPDCNSKVLTLYFKSIFSLYIGNIIYTGFFILKEEIFNG